MTQVIQDKRIFVTGGTGFLGYYILSYLLNRGFHRIKAICRESSSMEMANHLPRGVEWVTCDLADEFLLNELVGDSDIIIHAASMVSFRASDQNQIFNTNVEGTARLVNLALQQQIDKFVYVSSVSAFGSGTIGVQISEETEWMDAPLEVNYPKSKHYAEREVWRGAAEGLPVVSICPSFIVGAGSWVDGPLRIFKSIYHGMPYFPPGSNGVVDVRDVASIIVQCLGDEIRSVKLIASGANISHFDLMKEISQAFNKKPPEFKLPPWMIYMAAALESFKSMFSASEPIITSSTLKISLQHFEYDNLKSRELLGFQYIPFRKTILDTCQKFLETYPRGIHYAVFDQQSLQSQHSAKPDLSES